MSEQILHVVMTWASYSMYLLRFYATIVIIIHIRILTTFTTSILSCLDGTTLSSSFFSFRKMITIFIISSRFSLYSIRPFGYSFTLYLWDMWCLPLKHTKKNESTSCIFILKMGVKSLRILISVTSSCPFWHSSCSYSRRRMNSMAFSVATRLSSNHLPKMYFTSPVQCCYRYLPLV